MNSSWFFDENFNGLSDDFFDDVVKCFDFPLEDVELNNGEDWDAGFQNLEPPPANVLAGLSSDLSDNTCKQNVGVQQSRPMPFQYSGTSEVKQHPSTYGAPSSRSIFIHKSTNGKDSRLLQTSSPVSVLENSSSSSAENPASLNTKLSIPVKRTRSKRRRPSASYLQSTFRFISSVTASGESHATVESESESCLAEKSSKKKQKKKRNLTLLSGSGETKKSLPDQSVPTRKCMHCEVTKTPQWREGPMGPKTLCNACGVRYRSGRLLPEYRPAASPTFVPSLHSNSHKKVIEMRKKTEQLPSKSVTYTVTPENSHGSCLLDYY